VLLEGEAGVDMDPEEGGGAVGVPSSKNDARVLGWVPAEVVLIRGFLQDFCYPVRDVSMLTAGCAFADHEGIHVVGVAE